MFLVRTKVLITTLNAIYSSILDRQGRSLAEAKKRDKTKIESL